MLKSGVYRIDLGNGWFYVGSACNLEQRGRQHYNALLRGDHDNQIVQRVFSKYGKFVFTILGRCPEDEIIPREQILLDACCENPKCANMAPTAGSCLGVKHTNETRANMSATRRGRKKQPQTPEHRAKISAALTGYKKSPEHVALISATQTGVKRSQLTPEHRAKISAAKTGKKLSREHCAAMSKSRLGFKHSAATRAKISAAGIGRKHTPETLAKMSAAQSARYARRRLPPSSFLSA